MRGLEQGRRRRNRGAERGCPTHCGYMRRKLRRSESPTSCSTASLVTSSPPPQPQRLSLLQKTIAVPSNVPPDTLERGKTLGQKSLNHRNPSKPSNGLEPLTPSLPWKCSTN